VGDANFGQTVGWAGGPTPLHTVGPYLFIVRKFSKQ